jgi:tetratricopeptide (TPR) repeat protein
MGHKAGEELPDSVFWVQYKIMADNNTNKPQTFLSKSFMTAGPVLHYSHANIHLCWGLAIAVYLLACFFWSRLLIGEDLSVSLLGLFQPEYWNLGRFVSRPLSIYEYPWQIVVLGILMGILAVTPVVISQLLSFRYSLPMIITVMLVARLGLFGVVLMVSCAAVACRPLRFRSRFISIALCMSPQVLYWAFFGGLQSTDPLRWGFSYAPWVYAWLTSLFMAGVILAVGHFNRYKPGLLWYVSASLLILAGWLFYSKIGLAELDYQLYVANNNFEEADEFHTHSLTETLDEIIEDEHTRSFLVGRFYPTERLYLREKLKADIQNQLVYGRWPLWIEKKLSDSLRYQRKRITLLSQYDLFLEKRPRSSRVPVAMYYKSLLNETHPDIRQFGQTEKLNFYNDYPYYENILIWQELYDRFPASPEALEARWRIAMHEAGQGKFEKAQELCDVAISLVSEDIAKMEQDSSSVNSGFFSAFNRPAETAMTVIKLKNLSFRLKKLKELICQDNQGKTPQCRQRLAEFVMLNPYRLDYDAKLETLLAAMDAGDPLRDNALLSQAQLSFDPAVRMQKMIEITSGFAGSDGAVAALYEIAVLKVGNWKNSQNTPEIKRTALIETRAILSKLANDYPSSLWAQQAINLMSTLPTTE